MQDEVFKRAVVMGEADAMLGQSLENLYLSQQPLHVTHLADTQVLGVDEQEAMRASL